MFARTFVIVLTSVATVSMNAARGQQPMNLAYLASASNVEVQKLQYPPANDGKIAYNATILGTGALIASDDRGFDKTVLGTSSPTTHAAAEMFNHFGDLKYVAPALGLVYLSGGHTNQEIAWRSSIAVLKAGAVGLALKEIVGRERPYGPDDRADVFKPGSNCDTYFSFPSGHTLVAFSIATVWADEKPSERFAAYGIASLVGLSRIYSKAHWPSDVFFGALLGYTQGRDVFKGDTNLLSLQF